MTRIPAVRHQLLALHQVLVDAARRDFEREHGRLNAAEFLTNLVENPAFTWLQPLTALIVQVDELFEADEPPDDDVIDAWLGQVRTLLTPRDGGSEFQRRYGDLLQRVPDVAVAHGAAIRTVPPVEG